MLSENIKTIRKAKGLSQEELAVKMNVVRQTISKWEQGLSVPDADMLIALADALDTPVSELLGESVTIPEADELKAISQKLEVINLQLAQRQRSKRRTAHWIFIILAIIIVLIFAALLVINSQYLGWDFNDPEQAIIGTFLHSFEWIYVRVAPFVLIGLIVGIVLTRRKTYEK